ncbi:MAG: hypothetical protein DMF59_17095 [Acidobacteria bacterium]|nr:MAG: hypothetical protein DMF59_17095 [Acidobacteriota bacterium]
MKAEGRRQKWIWAVLTSAFCLLPSAFSQVIDDFNGSLNWQAHPSDGVSLIVSQEPAGRRASALRMDFDFHGHGGYAIAHKPVSIDLPPDFEFAFWIRGIAPPNNLEFKLIDATGDNVWWVNQHNYVFPKEWTRVVLKKRHFQFAWGPLGGGEPHQIAAIEIVVTAGSGGKGMVLIDDLTLTERHVASVDQPLAFTTPTIDFPETREFGGLIVENDAPNYEVQISSDAETWQTIYSVKGAKSPRQFLFTPETEARHIRVVPPARRVILEPIAWSASRNDFFTNVAREAPRGDYPRYFQGEQSYWTVVGVDGDSSEALFNIDGALEPEKGGYSIEPFLYTGERLLSWNDVQPAPALARGFLPIPSVKWPQMTVTDDLCRLRAAKSAGYECHALRRRPPLPGQPALAIPRRHRRRRTDPRHAIPQSHRRDRQLPADHPADAAGRLRSGALRRRKHRRLVAAGEAARNEGGDRRSTRRVGRILVSNASRGRQGKDRHDRCADARSIESERRDASSGFSRLGAEVRPRGRRPSAVSAGDQRQHPRQPRLHPHPPRWSIAAAGIAIVRTLVDPRRIDDLRGAAAARDVGGGQGVHRVVREISNSRGADPVPENDSHGELIYLIAEYYRHTHDRALVERVWLHVVSAVNYIDALRHQRMTPQYKNTPFYGLLPESISHEGYSAKPMHSYWDDFFTAKGLADATYLAHGLGFIRDEKRFMVIRDEFERDLLASIRGAMAMKQIDFIPGSVELGDFDPTSTTIAISPGGQLGKLPATALARTFDRYFDESRSRALGVKQWDAYTPYEWRTVGTFIRLGQPQRAYELTNFFMRGQRPPEWRQWGEVVWRDPKTPKFIGDMPHGWVASDFLRSVLDMFAYDRDDGALVIGAGILPEWATQTPGVTARNLDTHQGVVSFSMRGTNNAIHVTVSGPLSNVIVHSPVPKPKEVRVNGKVVAATQDVGVRSFPSEIVFTY